MTQMNHRKMPTRLGARLYMALASLLALAFGLGPTALFFLALSVCCLTVGVLSVPRATYIRVLLYTAAAGLVPAVAAGLIAKSPVYALAAFSVAPASALLALTIRRRNSRSAGIFWVAVAFTVTLVGAMLLWLYLRTGSLSLAVFKQLYTEVKTGFVSYMTEVLKNTPDNVLFLSGIDMEKAPAQLFQMLVTLLPGLFLMLMWLTAWMSTACLRWMFQSYVYGHDRFANWPVTVWKPLAFVYLTAFVMALLPIPSDVYTVIGIVCYNLFLPLLPIFTVVGCRMLKERLLRQPGCGCITLVALAMVITAVPTIPFLLLSITGALQTIFPPKFRPIHPFQPTGNGGQPPVSPYGEEEDSDPVDPTQEADAVDWNNTDDTDNTNDTEDTDGQATEEDTAPSDTDHFPEEGEDDQ